MRYLDEVESFLAVTAMHMENGYLGYRFSGIEGHPWDDRPFFCRRITRFFVYVYMYIHTHLGDKGSELDWSLENSMDLWIFN